MKIVGLLIFIIFGIFICHALAQGTTQPHEDQEEDGSNNSFRAAAFHHPRQLGEEKANDEDHQYKYDGANTLFAFTGGRFSPKPLLDTIREEEKYGNTMDHAAGRILVAGVESVSNLVNGVLEVPGSLLKKFTRVATEKLNRLGGRLIGL